jgi:hypothetical protein
MVNLAELIGKSSEDALNILQRPKGPKEPKEQEQKRKEQKNGNGFTHGNYVSIKVGMYKGLTGYVKEMIPGGITLLTKGNGFIEVDKYGEKAIGGTLLTNFGESKIEKRIKRVPRQETIKLCIYKTVEKSGKITLKVGEYINSYDSIVEIRNFEDFELSMEVINQIVLRLN